MATRDVADLFSASPQRIIELLRADGFDPASVGLDLQAFARGVRRAAAARKLQWMRGRLISTQPGCRFECRWNF